MPYCLFILMLPADLILKLSPLSTGCYRLGSAVEGTIFSSPIFEFKIMV